MVVCNRGAYIQRFALVLLHLVADEKEKKKKYIIETFFELDPLSRSPVDILLVSETVTNG